MSKTLNGRFRKGIRPFNSTSGEWKLEMQGEKKTPPALGMKLVAPAEDAAQRVNELQMASYSNVSSFVKLIWDFQMGAKKKIQKQIQRIQTVALNRSRVTGK